MSKLYTFYIMSPSGSSFKQTRISRSFFICIGIFFAILIAGGGYAGYDYLILKKKNFDISRLESEVAFYQKEVHLQRSQIQQFASDVNTLKTKLDSVQGFEQKIKIMAGINSNDEEQAGLFGVGGSMPEDLDNRIELAEKHHSLIREMHEQINQLDTAFSVQEQNFGHILKQMDQKRNLLSCTPAIRPASGWTSSRFGRRISPFTGMKEFHSGLDISAPKGTPIMAPANGVVTFTGRKGGMGIMITIDHGYGFATHYGHCSEILKKKGDRVKRGDVIAEVGNTGRSTGPHVHYEVRFNGAPVNPEKYILN